MRTLNEIRQLIQNDFINNLTIRDLYGIEQADRFENKFSPVSIEAIMINIIASAVYLYEKIIDGYKNDLSVQIASEYPFSITWYYDKIKSFQIGHTLVFDDNSYRFSYPAIVESAQIIKHAAIRQVLDGGVTKLKVYAAKKDREKLSDDEFNAFQSYVRQIGAAGTHFEFVPPMNADRLSLAYTGATRRCWILPAICFPKTESPLKMRLKII
jgi:hypothetical protein